MVTPYFEKQHDVEDLKGIKYNQRCINGKKKSVLNSDPSKLNLNHKKL